MAESKENDSIALIDKLQPALTGEAPRSRLSLFFCLSLLGVFLGGACIGANWGLSIQESQRLIVHISLTLATIICLGITGISTYSFMGVFQRLLKSLDSKEESQQAARITHHKQAAQSSQAKQPRDTKRKASHDERRA